MRTGMCVVAVLLAVLCGTAAWAQDDGVEVAMLWSRAGQVTYRPILSAPAVARFAELIREDQVGFLERLRENYERTLRDYTATLVKRERTV